MADRIVFGEMNSNNTSNTIITRGRDGVFPLPPTISTRVPIDRSDPRIGPSPAMKTISQQKHSSPYRFFFFTFIYVLINSDSQTREPAVRSVRDRRAVKIKHNVKSMPTVYNAAVRLIAVHVDIRCNNFKHFKYFYFDYAWVSRYRTRATRVFNYFN